MAEETSSTTDKLLQLVQNYKADEAESNAGSWIAGAVVLIIVLVGVVIFAYQQWQAGKERAKLLHEQAVAEEALHQADVDAELSKNTLERTSALIEADRARAYAADLAARSATLEARRDEARAKIDKITSWKDVDAIIR